MDIGRLVISFWLVALLAGCVRSQPLAVPMDVGREIPEPAVPTLAEATQLDYLAINLEEIGASFRVPFSQNRYLSSLAACGSIAFFAFYEVGGKPAALALW